MARRRTRRRHDNRPPEVLIYAQICALIIMGYVLWDAHFDDGQLNISEDARKIFSDISGR